MCGRFTLTQPAEIAARFDLDNFAPVEPEFYTPRFNVAPTRRIVAIPTSDGQRVARQMRCGIASFMMDVGSGTIGCAPRERNSVALRPRWPYPSACCLA